MLEAESLYNDSCLREEYLPIEFHLIQRRLSVILNSVEDGIDAEYARRDPIWFILPLDESTTSVG